MPNDFVNDCKIGCEPAFERVRISHLVAGNSRITWELVPRFNDRGPYTYTLQVGSTGNPEAADWQDVGIPVQNATYLTDDQQRLFGINNWTHYRIKLVTAEGTYYSKPQPALGNLPFRQWMWAQEITRKERLRMQQGAGTPGYLLKRMTSGTICHCVDFQTGQPRDPGCTTCYGTGFEGGYEPVLECCWAQLSTDYVDTDPKDVVSTSGPIVIKAERMLYEPQLFEYDVWVNKQTDERYSILRVDSISDIMGQTVLVSAKMELIPYSNVIYSLEIDGQEE